MNPPTAAALVAAAVFAVGDWLAVARRGTTAAWQRVEYVCKPATLAALVVAAATLDPAGGADARRGWFVAALVFSLLGDVLLMLPRDRFVAGLVTFLVAHLLYIGAFTLSGVRATGWIVLPLAAYGVVLLRILLPHVGRGLKAPVTVYAVVLLAMAWAAAERGAAGMPGGRLAAAGAVLFVASDSALAIDRFARQFRGADAVVLGTYYAAQTLIALSAGILGSILLR